MIKLKKCDVGKHDYERPIKLGRARYICPTCREDITLELVYIQEYLDDNQ